MKAKRASRVCGRRGDEGRRSLRTTTHRPERGKMKYDLQRHPSGAAALEAANVLLLILFLQWCAGVLTGVFLSLAPFFRLVSQPRQERFAQ